MEIVKKEIIIIITLGVGENGHFDKSFFAGEIFQHFFLWAIQSCVRLTKSILFRHFFMAFYRTLLGYWFLSDLNQIHHIFPLPIPSPLFLCKKFVEWKHERREEEKKNCNQDWYDVIKHRCWFNLLTNLVFIHINVRCFIFYIKLYNVWCDNYESLWFAFLILKYSPLHSAKNLSSSGVVGIMYTIYRHHTKQS